MQQRLIEMVARREIQELHEKGVRVRVLGRMSELPASLRAELERDMALTRENPGLNLNLAITQFMSLATHPTLTLAPTRS